jgi:hypothetical protein
MLGYLKIKIKLFFALENIKKNHPKKLNTYGSWEFFFSAAPTAPNSPELHFRFINSFIQPFLVGSLVQQQTHPNVMTNMFNCPEYHS